MLAVAAALALLVGCSAARRDAPLSTDDCADPPADCAELPEHFEAHRQRANWSALEWPQDLAKPPLLGRLYGPLARYVTAFGVVDSASKRVDAVFDKAAEGKGRWGFGYCVCEICHTVVETLQLKMFQDYGLGFQDQDVYDVRARARPGGRGGVAS
jgi:hypothetical protein